jgi:putative transposase
MTGYRKGAHTVYDIKYHLVWVTKYRYKVLRGEIGIRARELIRQICVAKEMVIIKGHIGPDHVHLFISAPPRMSVSQIMQYLKGKASYRLQQEYPTLKKRYWGQHIWA